MKNFILFLVLTLTIQSVFALPSQNSSRRYDRNYNYNNDYNRNYNNNRYNNRRNRNNYYNNYNNNDNNRTNIFRKILRRINQENGIKYVSNDMFNFDKLEKQILNQTYEYDLPETRLERLETKLFGASQSGTLTERYDVIKSAAKNYKAFCPSKQVYNQYRPPIFTGTAGSNWKNTLWGNFMNQFAGYPTGLTPQISQGMDPAYMDYFEAEREMLKNGYAENYYSTPKGYKTMRTQRGARTGVKILD